MKVQSPTMRSKNNITAAEENQKNPLSYSNMMVRSWWRARDSRENRLYPAWSALKNRLEFINVSILQRSIICQIFTYVKTWIRSVELEHTFGTWKRKFFISISEIVMLSKRLPLYGKTLTSSVRNGKNISESFDTRLYFNLISELLN